MVGTPEMMETSSFGQRVDEGLRIPPWEKRERGTGTQRGQRHVGEPEDVEQRQARRRPVIRGRLSHLLDDVRGGDEITQGQHGTLRLAGGPRGIEQGGQVIPVEFDTIELGDAVLSQPKARPLVADQRQGVEADAATARGASSGVGHGRVGHKPTCVRVLEDVVQLPGRRERIDGDRRKSGGVGAEEFDEELRARGGDEHRPITRTKSGGTAAIACGFDLAEEAQLGQRDPVRARGSAHCNGVRDRLRPGDEQIDD